MEDTEPNSLFFFVSNMFDDTNRLRGKLVVTGTLLVVVVLVIALLQPETEAAATVVVHVDTTPLL